METGDTYGQTEDTYGHRRHARPDSSQEGLHLKRNPQHYLQEGTPAVNPVKI